MYWKDVLLSFIKILLYRIFPLLSTINLTKLWDLSKSPLILEVPQWDDEFIKEGELVSFEYLRFSNLFMNSLIIHLISPVTRTPDFFILDRVS